MLLFIFDVIFSPIYEVLARIICVVYTLEVTCFTNTCYCQFTDTRGFFILFSATASLGVSATLYYYYSHIFPSVSEEGTSRAETDERQVHADQLTTDKHACRDISTFIFSYLFNTIYNKATLSWSRSKRDFMRFYSVGTEQRYPSPHTSKSQVLESDCRTKFKPSYPKVSSRSLKGVSVARMRIISMHPSITAFQKQTPIFQGCWPSSP